MIVVILVNVILNMLSLFAIGAIISVWLDGNTDSTSMFSKIWMTVLGLILIYMNIHLWIVTPL